MSLKTSFQNAVGAIGRFIAREEIKQLESRKGMAQAGYFFIPARTASLHRIGPDEAKLTIAVCDKRIAEIQQKYGLSPKP
jgi:hypothetical protein